MFKHFNTQSRRSLGRLLFLPIALIAFYASYWHLVAVCRWAGQDSASAHLIPIMVDALMLLASYTIFTNQSLRNRPKLSWGRVTQLFGLVATIAGNAADAYIHPADAPIAAALIVAGWPAVALFLSTETILFEGRRLKVAVPVKKTAPVAVKKVTKAKATTTAPRPVRHRKAPVPALVNRVEPVGWPA